MQVKPPSEINIRITVPTAEEKPVEEENKAQVTTIKINAAPVEPVTETIEQKVEPIQAEAIEIKEVESQVEKVPE